MKLYGEEKSNEEIIQFVRNYVDQVMKCWHSRFNATLPLLPEGGKYVLDYGCGWGHYAKLLSERGNKVKAIDLSSNEIDICELVWGQLPGVEFECAMIDAFQDETFDCVISSQVIEHVHNVGNYLSGINRVLKPGGQLIISTPNISTPRFFLDVLRYLNFERTLRTHSQKMLKEYSKTHHHIHAWDPHHFVNLGASLGFEMERFIPAEGIAFPFRWLPYIRTNRTIFGRWCYTMIFSFKKQKFVPVSQGD